MHKLLVRKPDAVIVLIAAYFILEFLVRLAMPHSMRYDESQQAFFSQWLTLGYDSQPPLYNWWQSLTISGLGLSLSVPGLPMIVPGLWCDSPRPVGDTPRPVDDRPRTVIRQSPACR